MARYATIIGTGMYLPPIEVPNSVLAEKFGPVIGKFEASGGIKTRFYAPDDWATSDLAVEAGKAALADAGIKPEDLDLIIVGTDSPDYVTPATSVVVQYKLGALKAGTFDVGCACASFPTGLNLAAGLIGSNPNLKYVLVIGAYMMHKLADLDKDVMSFFYGDGAGAAVLTGADKPGFVTSTFAADGSYHKHWGIYSGGTYEPVTADSFAAGRTKVKLITPFPATVNDEGWPARLQELAANGHFDLNDLDMIIFTQVRMNTIKQVMETLGLPIEKAHWIMHKWGYTGSACLPMAFDDARKQGKIKSGDMVAFVGSGVGYNQAGSVFIMP